MVTESISNSSLPGVKAKQYKALESRVDRVNAVNADIEIVFPGRWWTQTYFSGKDGVGLESHSH